MEKEQSFEVLALHKYKVILSSGEKTIAFPYGKTSAIIKIFLGTSGEFRELVKSIFTKDTKGFLIDRIELIYKALDMFNEKFADSLVDAFTKVVNTALNEYDNDGRLTVAGNCLMLPPEDVHKIFSVVIADIGDVLKNVFGMEVTKPRKKRLSSRAQPQEKTTSGVSLL